MEHGHYAVSSSGTEALGVTVANINGIRDVDVAAESSFLGAGHTESTKMHATYSLLESGMKINVAPDASPWRVTAENLSSTKDVLLRQVALDETNTVRFSASGTGNLTAEVSGGGVAPNMLDVVLEPNGIIGWRMGRSCFK